MGKGKSTNQRPELNLNDLPKEHDVVKLVVEVKGLVRDEDGEYLETYAKGLEGTVVSAYKDGGVIEFSPNSAPYQSELVAVKWDQVEIAWKDPK